METGTLSYPYFQPDTPAGHDIECSSHQELQDKHNRIPPGKRPNYTKLGVVAPFHTPWGRLAEEWVTVNLSAQTGVENDRFYQVRDRRVLKRLQAECGRRENRSTKGMDSSTASTLSKTDTTVSVNGTDTETRKQNDPAFNGDLGTSKVTLRQWLSDFDIDMHGLVPVTVTMAARGRPEERAMICVPTSDDLVTFTRDPDDPGPVEPPHKDEQWEERRKMGHKTPTVQDYPKVPSGVRRSQVNPSDPSGVEREVGGWVTGGGFSLSKGGGYGMGLIALPALVAMVEMGVERGGGKGVVCVVRGTTSLQYRYATLTVVL